MSRVTRNGKGKAIMSVLLNGSGMLSTSPLHTNSAGCGNERRILISPW